MRPADVNREITLKQTFMKQAIIFLAVAAMFTTNINAETVTLNDQEYEINTLIDRDLGPGVRYTRLRIPDYPLNVNMLRIDVSNPYVSVETTQASDKLYGTESLVKAASRQTAEGHKALAGANANFWCVSGQPPFSSQLIGVTYNGNLKNGKIITETNMYSDQWNGGYKHTGVVGVTPDGRAMSGHFSWKGYVTSAKFGTLEFQSANKLVRDEELSVYNSFYSTTRTFRCVNQVAGSDGKQTFEIIPNCATEVYLTLDADQKWTAGQDMTFTVSEVKTNAGDGTLGNYDLALVGRGSKATALASLATGDKVTLKYGWIAPEGDMVEFTNLVGGNAQVMVAGELTKFNTSETYNSQIYSRTGYGVSQDGKMLYIIVIDKSSDGVYGTSAGCSTTVMCAIAKHYGVYDMTNFDAGGSAEMLVDGAIINRTTEGTPRAVANGMIAYSVAPKDDAVARLEFYDIALKAPVYATYAPRVIAYNQYGDIVNDDFKDYTLSCPAEAGACSGNEFTASNTPGTYTLTASYNGVTTTAPIEICQADIAIRLKPIVIDNHRDYKMEVTASIGRDVYSYNPASIEWSSESPEVAYVDANGMLCVTADKGSAVITGKIGEFTDQTTVNIENATANILTTDDLSQWGIKGSSGMTGFTWADGKYTYTYKTARSVYVTLTPDGFKSYGLPDKLSVTFNSSVPLTKIDLDIRTRTHTRKNAISVTPADGNEFAPGEHTMNVDLPGDISDLQTYPFSINSIQCYMTASSAYNGEQTIMLNVHQHYSWIEGVEDILINNAGDIDINKPYDIYDMNGRRVKAAQMIPGIYIMRQGANSRKVIIR